MKVKELIEQLLNCNPEDKVAVQIDKGFVTVGGTPRVGVESASSGFDWDHGTVFLKLEAGKMLTDVSREEYLEHIRYKQLVTGLRGRQNIELLSDVFVRKDFVIGRLTHLVDVEELEQYEVPNLITDIKKEKL